MKRRTLPSPVVVIAASILCASCANSETRQDATHHTAESDPPGAARALSLGSEGLLNDDSTEGGNAIRCAAALKSTRETLTEMSNAVGATELAAIRAIERQYVREAIRLGAAGRQSANAVNRVIERQVLVGKDQSAQQAQLALACANSLQTRSQVRAFRPAGDRN